MDTQRVLYFCDPLNTDAASHTDEMHIGYPNIVPLHFSENECWLHKALRRFSEEKCAIIAAEGGACALALAVAVQLPADVLLLHRCAVLRRSNAKEMPAQLRRVSGFVRRNLSLIVSRIRLSDTDESEVLRLCKGVSHYAQIEINAEKCMGNGWIEAFLHQL